MTASMLSDVRAIVKELQEHRENYYSGSPTITDAEYDALEVRLSELVDQNPELAEEAAILNEVGGPGESTLFTSVTHAHPMLSLDKVHDLDGVKKFLTGLNGERVSLWPKYDGVSLSLTYEDGKLVRAATRGDGTIGEDITDNVWEVVGVPHQLDQPVDCELRGEVVMMKSDFNSFNTDNPDSQLKNPRNAAAGTLRAKSRDKVADRVLTFLPFDLIWEDGPDFAYDCMTALGIDAGDHSFAETFEQVEQYIANMDSSRESLDYDIDGVVIKVADRIVYAALGNTSHHPRGAVAFKLAAEVGETTLEGVIWQVGKSGIVAPVAEISPLFLAGTTIARASLHNMAIIAERDIRVGDRIQIKRAGDVIPHVIGPVTSVRTSDEKVITAPSACPSCGSTLVATGESDILRCENALGCDDQQIRRLIHWAGRSAADIDAIGESWIERLFAVGLLKRPSDFYKLSKEDLLAQGEGMGERLADKMLASIENSKNLGLRRAIIGFSIHLASEGTAKRICRSGVPNFEELLGMSSEQLCEIEDIGPMVADSLVAFLAMAGPEIAALRNSGVNLNVLPEDAPVIVADASGAFVGKTVCVTGTLSVGRKEFEALIEAAGGKATGSVSKNTDFLVAGENAGSKLTKAEAAGVTVLTEDRAREMMG